jgi:hypothetical protein
LEYLIDFGFGLTQAASGVSITRTGTGGGLEIKCRMLMYSNLLYIRAKTAIYAEAVKGAVKKTNFESRA